MATRSYTPHKHISTCGKLNPYTGIVTIYQQICDCVQPYFTSLGYYVAPGTRIGHLEPRWSPQTAWGAPVHWLGGTPRRDLRINGRQCISWLCRTYGHAMYASQFFRRTSGCSRPTETIITTWRCASVRAISSDIRSATIAPRVKVSRDVPAGAHVSLHVKVHTVATSLILRIDETSARLICRIRTKTDGATGSGLVCLREYRT